MKDQLLEDFKKAMKENNSIKKNTIQLIRALILQKEKDEQKELTEKEIEDLIMSEKKKRIESLGQFEKVKRTDLIEQTNKEISYLSNYLPKLISDYELEVEVKQVIETLNAKKSEMGKVIRKVKEDVGNQATGKQISDCVKKCLGIGE